MSVNLPKEKGRGAPPPLSYNFVAMVMVPMSDWSIHDVEEKGLDVVIGMPLMSLPVQPFPPLCFELWANADSLGDAKSKLCEYQ